MSKLKSERICIKQDHRPDSVANAILVFSSSRLSKEQGHLHEMDIVINS